MYQLGQKDPVCVSLRSTWVIHSNICGSVVWNTSLAGKSKGVQERHRDIFYACSTCTSVASRYAAVGIECPSAEAQPSFQLLCIRFFVNTVVPCVAKLQMSGVTKMRRVSAPLVMT